ncbi:hypothetical protein GOP47_0004764 [Adiantum capillus-veneris]|uniref:Single-stranded DNA binding protein Ssb-like OB fold domain-containing protein n=1 Tax=Adiantum capillus-veneris TaxID=13818 RepID=A0A9D4ZNI2_ADICA|nr:hypothetical protein GOP47_0004764 [Adiantum capillus-veneris]
MAASKQKQGTAIKVQELRPGTSGHNLVVKVLNAKQVMQKSRFDAPQRTPLRLAECLVGDETAVIVFPARNEQVDVMQEGATVILNNAKVDMFRGSMRLAVDKWQGSIEVTEPATFSVKSDNNLSLIEFELILVDE